MRRDSNDLKWKQVKGAVYSRDNNSCRLCRVLSIQEMLILKRNANGFLKILDPAHYIAVNQNPSIMYDSNNICVLNRYSHSNLDSFKDPIDGHSITSDEVHKWWERILKGNKKQYDYLKSKDLI